MPCLLPPGRCPSPAPPARQTWATACTRQQSTQRWQSSSGACRRRHRRLTGRRQRRWQRPLKPQETAPGAARLPLPQQLLLLLGMRTQMLTVTQRRSRRRETRRMVAAAAMGRVRWMRQGPAAASSSHHPRSASARATSSQWLQQQHQLRAQPPQMALLLLLAPATVLTWHQPLLQPLLLQGPRSSNSSRVAVVPGAMRLRWLSCVRSSLTLMVT